VMAARLGCNTAIIGKVGNDMFGGALIENLVQNGVNIDHVGVESDTGTATAAILVDDSGQYKIACVLGANCKLKVEDVKKASSKLAKARVVVCDLEVPQEAALEVLKIGKENKARTIFNPSPLPPKGFEDIFYKYSDFVVANEQEVGQLVGFPLSSDQDVDQALSVLLKKGASIAVVTLGSRGCAYATKDDIKPVRVPAPVVNVLDVTGAGDAFLGSLAYFQSRCPTLTLREQIHRSCHIASITTQSKGTQPSYPNRDQLLKKDLLS